MGSYAAGQTVDSKDALMREKDTCQGALFVLFIYRPGKSCRSAANHSIQENCFSAKLICVGIRLTTTI